MPILFRGEPIDDIYRNLVRKLYWKLIFFAEYFWNIFIAIDQLINTLFFGDPDETMSSRCGKSIRRMSGRPRKCTIAYWLNKFLDLFEKDHSINNIEDDEGRNNLI